MALLTMYDSIRADGMPPDGDVYACYTDGIYANEAAVRAKFPDKPIVRISAVGRADADYIDIEPGCVWPPANARAWLDAHPDAGIYCGLANLASVVAALGTDRHYWVAHYTNRPHICTRTLCGFNTAGANIIGVQYGGDSNAGGYHFDVSVMTAAPGIAAASSADATPIGTTTTEEEEDDMANYLPLYIVGMDGHARSNDPGSAYYLVNDNESTYTWINPVQLDRFRGLGLQIMEQQGADIVGQYKYIGPGDYEVVVVAGS